MTKFEQVEEIIESMIADLKGIDKEYLTDEQYDEGEDIVYAQPRYVTTDKNCHFHLEYVMMSIEKGGIIRSMGMGEDHGDAKVLSVDDLSWGDVIALHNITFPPCDYCGEQCYLGEGCDEYNAEGFGS